MSCFWDTFDHYLFIFDCITLGIACLIVGGILMFATSTSPKEDEFSPLIPVFTGVLFLVTWGFVLRLYFEMKEGEERYDTISVPNDN